MASLVTMSLVGLLVGFIFSVPIAGPISILITTNALKGRLRYCNLATLGASIADFVYVFGAVFGITKFYSFFKPLIPYILLIGALFLLYLGYKISKTNVDLEHLGNEHQQKTEKKERSGFLTGFSLNFLNPTLFVSWLTTSFIVISLVSSLGFNTGGLDKSVDISFNSLNKKGEDTALKNKTFSYLHLNSSRLLKKQSASQMLPESKGFSFLLSLCYAFFLSLGGILWFFLLAYFLARYRQKINIKIINGIIHSLGWLLCVFGLFLGYKAISMFI